MLLILLIDDQNSHGTACLSTLGGWSPDILIGSGFGASFVLGKTVWLNHYLYLYNP